MIQKLLPFIDDAFAGISRMSFGMFGTPPAEYEGRYGGKYGGSEFFNDAKAGNSQALARLDREGYGDAWKIGMRGQVQREVTADLRQSRMATRFARETKRGATPFTAGYAKAARKSPWGMKGIATGRPAYGYGKFADNLWGKQAKLNLGFGVVTGAIMMANAPKGHMLAAGAKTFGATAGTAVGAAIGGAFLGLPGELAGGLLGATIGEKVGDAIEPFEKIGRQAGHANFGGHYEDSEPAYTMRARAVQEMGR